MNVWNSKLVKAGASNRVTAGGASKLVIGKASTLPTLVETSWDGTNWHDVTAWFAAAIVGELLVLHSDVGSSAKLLGSQIRCNQDFYLMQED